MGSVPSDKALQELSLFHTGAITLTCAFLPDRHLPGEGRWGNLALRQAAAPFFDSAILTQGVPLPRSP
jgi:hypothetical protein